MTHLIKELVYTTPPEHERKPLSIILPQYSHKPIIKWLINNNVPVSLERREDHIRNFSHIHFYAWFSDDEVYMKWREQKIIDKLQGSFTIINEQPQLPLIQVRY